MTISTTDIKLRTSERLTDNADGTSTIQTYGGFFRARGQTVPIGQQAEIEGGAVVRQAVTLPTVVIEV